MNYSHSRLQKDSNKLVQEYVASIPFDRRLYRQDIEGSIAHARMLAKQGIIAGSEAAAIIKGLNSIRKEIERGKFQFKTCLLYTSPSPRDRTRSRMPSSA